MTGHRTILANGCRHHLDPRLHAMAPRLERGFGGALPASIGIGQSVAVTSSCVTVGTLNEFDGETAIYIGTPSELPGGATWCSGGRNAHHLRTTWDREHPQRGAYGEASFRAC